MRMKNLTRIKNFALVFFFAAFSVLPKLHATADGPKLPDTAAGRRMAAFIKAFNSTDDAVKRDFHANNAAKAVAEGASFNNEIEKDKKIHSEIGDIELHSVIESSATDITVLLHTKKGRWIRLSLELEPEPPHGIVGIRLGPADPPARSDTAGREAKNPESAAKGKMSDAEIASSLAAYLDGLAKDDKFSGVVVIAKDGKPVLEKIYGLADKRKQTPNRIDTKFNLGSMNKMFTSVAIAQLAERGKLAFTDTVGKRLPDYPNKAVADKVTIHHLLTHTSGMGSYWNDKFDKNKSNIKTVADYVALFVDDALSFEPGAKFQYSNSGFIVLGAIIEKVSGQSYYDYVREHIFKPAGMKNTDAYESSHATPNLAMGYTRMGDNGPEPGPRKENAPTRPNRGGPAGGGYSTAEDLLKFHIALRDHKLLSAKYTDIITTGKVETGRGKYAYGFGDQTINGKRAFGHNGGAPGIASSLEMYPELGYTVVVMTNYDPPDMMPVVRKIQEMLTGK